MGKSTSSYFITDDGENFVVGFCVVVSCLPDQDAAVRRADDLRQARAC